MLKSPIEQSRPIACISDPEPGQEFLVDSLHKISVMMCETENANWLTFITELCDTFHDDDSLLGPRGSVIGLIERMNA